MDTREIAVEYRLAHWAQIVQNREDSGLSVRTFCENIGIQKNSFYYWRKKLREATRQELTISESSAASIMPPVFAEVKLASRVALPTSEASDQNRVCVEVAGVRITADGGYPADKLAYLTREVSRPC